MDLKMPNLKSFSSFVNDTIYVVECMSNGFKKAFITRNEAEQYWDLKNQQNEEPKMRNKKFEELSSFLTEEQFEDFKKRYIEFFDNMNNHIDKKNG